MGSIKGLHPDVIKRDAPKVGDQELGEAVRGGGSTAGKLARGAGNNAVGVGKDIVNVGLDVGNIALGVGQVAKGVLGTLKDLLDAGRYKTANALASGLDAEADKLLKSGQLPEHERLRAENMKKVAANLRAIKEEDFAKVKEGLTRICKGIGYGVIDLASLPKDAAEAVLQIMAAGGVVLVDAAVAIGAAIGRGLYNAGVAIKDAAVWTAGKTWEGIQWTAARVKEGAVWIKDGVVFLGREAIEAAKKGAIAVRDGVVYVGGKIADGAVYVGDLLREGLEDSFAGISNGAAWLANQLANKNPRFDESRKQPDAPAHQR